jgi:hypothetical protein
VIATLDTAVTTTATDTPSIIDTLESMFAGLDFRADGSDLVIDELDRWRNAKDAVARLSGQTFNFVAVAGR